MNLSDDQENELLFVGYNQDFGLTWIFTFSLPKQFYDLFNSLGCFACGTDNGFRIFNVNPFRETFRRGENI